MKLPYRDRALVPAEKVTNYLLNVHHARGRGKATFFMRYGFSAAKWQQLANALIDHAQIHEVMKIEQTAFGTRYVVEGELETPIARSPQVRVVWFVGHGESEPRLVTAYPVED